MTLEEAVVSLLLGHEGLAALVGDRVNPTQAPPAETYPYLVYTRADQQRLQTLNGYINTNRYSMHLEVFGEDYDSCEAVYRLLRKPATDGDDPGPLVGYSGTVTSGDESVVIQGVFERTGGNGVLPPVKADPSGVCFAGLDLTIIYAG